MSRHDHVYAIFQALKVAFIKEADVLALFPGGLGTLDKAMEVLTLVQTGKCDPIPLVLVDEPGGIYWSHWKRYVEKELAARGYISRDDFSLFDLAQSVEDAVAIIGRFYRRYHGLRMVGERLVMRLTSTPLEENVAKWREAFVDILKPCSESFLSQALPEGADEPDLAHLPRLVMDFNRRHYGRLRQLIDAVNAGQRNPPRPIITWYLVRSLAIRVTLTAIGRRGCERAPEKHSGMQETRCRPGPVPRSSLPEFLKSVAPAWNRSGTRHRLPSGLAGEAVEKAPGR